MSPNCKSLHRDVGGCRFERNAHPSGLRICADYWNNCRKLELVSPRAPPEIESELAPSPLPVIEPGRGAAQPRSTSHRPPRARTAGARRGCPRGCPRSRPSPGSTGTPESICRLVFVNCAKLASMKGVTWKYLPTGMMAPPPMRRLGAPFRVMSRVTFRRVGLVVPLEVVHEPDTDLPEAAEAVRLRASVRDRARRPGPRRARCLRGDHPESAL